MLQTHFTLMDSTTMASPEGAGEGEGLHFISSSIQTGIDSSLLPPLLPLLLLPPPPSLARLPVHCGIEISQRWESNSICWADTRTQTHLETVEAVHPGAGLSKQAHSTRPRPLFMQENTHKHTHTYTHTRRQNAISTVIKTIFAVRTTKFYQK